MDETRRTMAEVITRYRLEPSLRDVYVEGPFDAGFLAWLLRSLALNNTVVYTISTVDIPPGILTSHGLTSGEKQRIVAFAREVANALGDCSAVSCIVDADLDRIFGIALNEPLILVTDYTSLEVYLFHRPVLEQWLSLSARLPSVDCAKLMKTLGTTLRELFLVRCASLALGWNLTWISLDAGIVNGKARKSRAFAFDPRQFIDRLLHRNKRATDKATLLARVEEFRSKLPDDIRHAIHGNDLIELLVAFVRCESRQRWLFTREAVLGSLSNAARLEHLEHEEMFLALAARVKAT